MPLRIDHVTVGTFEENCYLVADPESGEAVLVDPGDEFTAIADLVARHGVTPSAVWLTHAHLDHIGAVSAVRRAWPGIPVWLHPADASVYAYAHMAAARYGLPWEQPEPHDRDLADGMCLTVGAHAFGVWHVPGHAPGHVAFVGEDVVLGGDCLFAGSVGRTDLPLCDPRAFAASLARLMTLGDAMRVLPGHGPATSIGRERVANPFLNGQARVPGA